MLHGFSLPHSKIFGLCGLDDSFRTLQDADDEAERDNLREVSKRLYAQLQDAEKKHLEEKEKLQVRHGLYSAFHSSFYS